MESGSLPDTLLVESLSRIVKPMTSPKSLADEIHNLILDGIEMEMRPMFTKSLADRIILDLCGGTGAWSRPYAEAGYDVRLVTLPEQDVRTYWPPVNVHGILAAPPCTEFAVSGARWWASKPPERLREAVAVVNACLRIIKDASPVWWALENPVGRLRKWIGPPVASFDPCDYGDPWTKRTLLWGRFVMPEKRPVQITPRKGSSPIHRAAPGPKRAEFRSLTPPGFARAFFEANP
jgi:hypothetical protein